MSDWLWKSKKLKHNITRSLCEKWIYISVSSYSTEGNNNQPESACEYSQSIEE